MNLIIKILVALSVISAVVALTGITGAIFFEDPFRPSANDAWDKVGVVGFIHAMVWGFAASVGLLFHD